MSKRKESDGDGMCCHKRHAANAGHAESGDGSRPELDCVFQVNHESHANRLIHYFNDECIRNRLFPVDPQGGACAVSAGILGYGNSIEKTGNLMVILSKITMTPREWVTWMHSSIFHHVITRMYFLEGGQDEKSVSSIPELVERMQSEFSTTGPVRLMCCPRTLEAKILDVCEKMGDQNSLEFHPVTFKHVLHVIQQPDGFLRYSLRAPEETYHTKPDGSARVPGQFCKAAGKLHEALLVTGFLEECVQSHDIAIDVGAAPGGWTHQLASYMKTVIAIDPAELHPTVLALKNVQHVKKMSQEAGPEIEGIVGDGCVSLISCDANRPPYRLGEMLAPSLKYLKKGGLLILTLKFNGKGENLLKKGLKGLSEAFFKGDAVGESSLTDMHAIFLLANTQNERTVVARKA